MVREQDAVLKLVTKYQPQNFQAEPCGVGHRKDQIIDIPLGRRRGQRRAQPGPMGVRQANFDLPKKKTVQTTELELYTTLPIHRVKRHSNTMTSRYKDNRYAETLCIQMYFELCWHGSRVVE